MRNIWWTKMLYLLLIFSSFSLCNFQKFEEGVNAEGDNPNQKQEISVKDTLLEEKEQDFLEEKGKPIEDTDEPPVEPPPLTDGTAKTDDSSSTDAVNGSETKTDPILESSQEEEVRPCFLEDTGEEEQRAKESSSIRREETIKPPPEGERIDPDKIPQPPQAGQGQDKPAASDAVPPTEEAPAPEATTTTDDIPSFEEWKHKMLNEQKQQEKEKVVTPTTGDNGKNGQSAQAPANGQPARKLNYNEHNSKNQASSECGAKVLSANPESQHTSAVLIQNRDIYMLNPCSAKIWFVVEMCEPIQIKQLEIANFELFSSIPKSFHVHISDRFPAREWRILGKFHARNERNVQRFPIHNEGGMFAKFIKLEMHSHFGSEHYCPLSMLRVFGTSMVEEIEESVEDSIVRSEPPNEDSLLTDLDKGIDKGKRGSFIGDAINTMGSIIKTAHQALTNSDTEEPCDGILQEQERSSQKDTTESQRCIPQENLVYPEPCLTDEEAVDGPTPRPEDVQVLLPSAGLLAPAWDTPLGAKYAQHCLCCHSLPASSPPLSLGNLTWCHFLHLALSHQLHCCLDPAAHPELSTVVAGGGSLLEEGAGHRGPHNHSHGHRPKPAPSDDALISEPSKRAEDKVQGPGGSGKVGEEIPTRRGPAVGQKGGEGKRGHPGPQGPFGASGVDEEQAEKPVDSSRDEGAAVPPPGQSVQAEPSQMGPMATLPTRPGHGGTPQLAEEPSQLCTKPPASALGLDNFQAVPETSATRATEADPARGVPVTASTPSADHDLPVDSAEGAATISPTPTQTAPPSTYPATPLEDRQPVATEVAGEVSAKGEGGTEIVPDFQPGDQDNQTVETAKPVDNATSSSSSSSSHSTTVPAEDNQKLEEPVEEQINALDSAQRQPVNEEGSQPVAEPAPATDFYAKDESPSSAAAADGTPDPDGPESAPPLTPQGVVTTPSQKESVFMRLNNRIKELELNMNLSIQYLEQLSKRYRKQMEEMQKEFAKTFEKLKEDTKKNEEKNLEQQSTIELLQEELNHTTLALHNMAANLENANREVVEQLIFWTMLSAAICFGAFYMCCRRRARRAPSPTTPSFTTSALAAEKDIPIVMRSPPRFRLHGKRRRNSMDGAIEPYPPKKELLSSQAPSPNHDVSFDERDGSHNSIVIIKPLKPLQNGNLHKNLSASKKIKSKLKPKLPPAALSVGSLPLSKNTSKPVTKNGNDKAAFSSFKTNANNGKTHKDSYGVQDVT